MSSSRRVFVGDIHGCLDSLNRLLEAVEFRPGHDQLFATGDLVNKGPDSEGVLRRLIDLGAQSVLGNHDLYWLRAGRLEDRALAIWLEEQPLVRLLDDLVIVHAGLHPAWSESELEVRAADHVEFVVNVRYCDAGGRRPESDWPVPGAPYRAWDDWWTGRRRRVVFGHWARRGLDVRDNAIALDSGCVYGRRLSAWIAEEDRVVQVDSELPERA